MNSQNIANTTLPKYVQQPSYIRKKLQSRILHFGFGAFHRAHQALLTDRVLNLIKNDWGICEISLFNRKIMLQLKNQEHLFTVLEKDSYRNVLTVVGSVKECLSGVGDTIEKIIEKICEPQVEIISLTVTEKGYCCNLSSGKVDLKDARILHDIKNPSTPCSIPGILVEAFKRRKNMGLPGVSVLSCDNIPNNGKVLKEVVLFLADQTSFLSQWITDYVTFPSTMVDRIVPATSKHSFLEIENLLHVKDPCAVSCESFIQWIIEDNFISQRPKWEILKGVNIVKNVSPWEKMKLRMLNGSHSFLAYTGYLAGFKYISDCLKDSRYKTGVKSLMMYEQVPTLQSESIEVDLNDYSNDLIKRFSNSQLKHLTWQIAMDGSQKLPQRILNSVRVHLEKGTRWPLLAFCIASWMRYISGTDDSGQVIDVRDPLLKVIQKITISSTENNRVEELLKIGKIFGKDLPRNFVFVSEIKKMWRLLLNLGTKKALSNILCEYYNR